MSDQDTPRNQTVENFLREVHSDFIGAFLKDAETATNFTTSPSFVTLWRGTIGKAKEFLKDTGPAILPAFPFQNHLARIEEAERTFDGLGPIENDVTTPDQGRALLRTIRTVFDSFGAVLDALGEADKKRAAKERAAHARKVRAERRAKETPEKEKARITAAVDAANALKTEATDGRRYLTVANVKTNVAMEPAFNSIPRGVREVPLVFSKGGALGFFKNAVGLTGKEVLGPVERQVFLAVVFQASRQNPADLVGVNISAYAALHGITYAAAKKDIEKAMLSLGALGQRVPKKIVDRYQGFPLYFNYFDSVWGWREEFGKETEGFYFVELGRSFAQMLEGGHAIQFPLFPTISLQANPNADLFVQLFAMNCMMNWGDSNQDIVSVEKIVQAAGLLKDKKHLDRARVIVERDLRAVERSGSAEQPAPFLSHSYTKDGVRVPTTKALSMPLQDWLGLNVKVVWSEGALDYSKKARAVEKRKERLAQAETGAIIRKGKTK